MDCAYTKSGVGRGRLVASGVLMHPREQPRLCSAEPLARGGPWWQVQAQVASPISIVTLDMYPKSESVTGMISGPSGTDRLWQLSRNLFPNLLQTLLKTHLGPLQSPSRPSDSGTLEGGVSHLGICEP